MMEKIKKIIPQYTWLPLIAMLSFNCFVYFGTRLFISDAGRHDMSNALDNALPLVTPFISIYLLAFAQWVIGYIVIVRDSRELCRRAVTAEIIAKAITLLCFIVYPTKMTRPEITGNGIWDLITRFVYFVDAPNNLFPSIHCLESWMVFRAALGAVKPTKTYKCVILIFTLLVFASTVLVKQHVTVDILGAVVAVEIGIFVSWKVWDRIGRRRPEGN